jgi:F0F1-type ATP synthase assembly protein I
MAQSENDQRNIFNTLLIVLVGQMGCLALLVIFLTVSAGVWLDNYFHTKPIITLALLLAGIPLSIILMVFMGRKTLAKLKSKNNVDQDETTE